jgi:hypothetical protein
MQSRFRPIPANYQNPEKRQFILQPPKRKQFPNVHNLAITYREMNLEKSSLSKLVLGLCSQTQPGPTEPQDSNTIRPNQIMRKQKRSLLDTLE